MRIIKILFATLMLAVMLLNTISAQDIDRKTVDVTYIRLPLKTLPPEIATYYVNVKSKTTSWGNSLGNVYDAEQIRFNGYYRLPEAGDADLLVENEVINDLVFDKAEERTATLTYKKDKNSPEIKYTANYYYVTYYTPKVHYTMRTKGGKQVADGFVGGVLTGFDYGSTSYSDYFSSSYPLASAWRNDKYGVMAKDERTAYQSAMSSLQYTCLSYSMMPARVEYSVRYVDEKKGKNVYADLLQARDYYIEAVSTLANDKITMINKLVQPDYQVRKETMQKAIDLWEKALAEADFDNKKARIDSKVGRHLYYNLALAYLWIDDFAKAKEYAQGRKKDVGSWDKNLMSGIRDLSALIDERAARQEANKWRTVFTADSNVYVYKDPATRLKEQEDLVKAEQARLVADKAARADSIRLAKIKGKATPKGKPVVKTAAGAKKTTTGKTSTVSTIK